MTRPHGVECRYDGGAGTGEAPLTWAQQFMNGVIQAAGTPHGVFDLFLFHDLGTPRELEAARDLIVRFLLRHPVLRTELVRRHDGRLMQRVRGAGTVAVPVHEGDPGSSELRDAVPATTLRDPTRFLFVTENGVVVRVAARISHLHTDAGGGKLLVADLAALEAGADEYSGETPSGLDLSRFESSADGAAVDQASATFAAAVYNAAPPTMWTAAPRAPEPERFRFGALHSPALASALDILAREHSVSRAGALTGALAAVTAASAGLDSALIFLISGNRFDPAWSAYPGALSQEAVLHLPVAGSALATMRDASGGVLRSLRRARYSSATMNVVREEVRRRRGVCSDGLGTAVVLNLLALDHPPPPEPGPTTFTWTGATDAENLGFYVDARSTDSGFVLHVRLDTRLLSPHDGEARLRAMEWMIVTAARRDVGADEVRERVASLRKAAPS